MADDSKFVLRWEINNAIATLADKKAESGVFIAGGFQWKAYIYCNPCDEAKIAYFLAFDHPLSNDWRCELELEYVLHSTKWDHSSHKRFSMNNDVNRILIDSRLRWTELFNIDNGYLNDDKIVVEFRINIMCAEAIPILSDSTKFCSPNEKSNVTIVIGESKLQVSKNFLADHIPVISAMFIGNFFKKEKEEIELENVVYKEFIDLLLVTFSTPGTVEITERTVGHIVKLADRFDIEHVLDLSKKFLMQSKDIEDVSKLLLADRYKFDSLRDHCIQSNSHRTVLLWKHVLNLSKKFLIQSKDIEDVSKLVLADHYKFDSLRDHCIQSYSDYAEMLKLMSRPEWKLFSAVLKAAVNDRIAMLMTNAGRIKLIFVSQDGNELHYLAKYGASLGKLKESYADKIGISVDSLRFLFDGRRFTDDDTPESLEMKYDDVIEVYQAM